MFIRLKKIQGKSYAYLVENEWTPWGSRQKVVSYMGRVIQVERKKDNYVKLTGDFRESVKQLVEQEIGNHNAGIDFDGKTVKKDGKETIIEMNEGFLCKHTLKELLEFEIEERPDKTAEKLAKALLGAGLRVNDEQMLHLFEVINRNI